MKQLKKVFFNMSMTNGSFNGVEIYSLKLKNQILQKKIFNAVFLYIKRTRFLSVYRLFWNFFIMPILVRRQLVYSFSSHGSPFIKNQIITIHDLICFSFPAQHKFQFYYFKYFIPIIIKSSKKVVAISEFTKSEILKDYDRPNDKGVVIHNGANRLRYDENEDDEDEFLKISGNIPFFITVGASYIHKNIENQLKAIALLGNLDVNFIIVAKKNAYGNYLRQMAKELGLKNVIFLHYVSENLLSKLYKEAICNIYISSYEGFGFPPLEAASMNTVSLVSKIEVMKEILGDNAIFVDSSSPQSIASQIKAIYLNRNKLDMYKSGFDDLLNKFTWENAGKNVMNLIENTIN
ncbi:glycosyltransferase family 4 protein [Kaistella carnis]|uniref:glycosyltransferase family 4 protein n=1 Tax=Kaistella carnis TaxID=1241979 RepID=UPI0028A86D1F|nr:glycosyltransferase family 1 protein [Kaistella carnis]